MEPPDRDPEFLRLEERWTRTGDWVTLPERDLQAILKDRLDWRDAARAYRRAVEWEEP